MDDFKDLIKQHIIDRLWELEDNAYYACDLSFELTMDENMDGFWIAHGALEFIADHIDVAAETFEYLHDELCMTVNPFENPEMYTFFMLDYGVRNALYPNDYLDEHWNEKIILDSSTINTIIEQL